MKIKTIVLFALTFTAGTEVLAQPTVPRKRVLVLPVKDYRIDPSNLFPEGSVEIDRPEEPNVHDAILSVLSSEPEVEVVTLQGFASGQRPGAAEGFLDLGIDLYKNLRLDDAVQTLQKAVEAGRSEFWDVISPKKMFDVYLYLGISYLEQGRPALAHVAFRNMFLVAPREAFVRREFRRGYFPAQVEEAIRAAAEDFVRAPLPEVFLGSQQRAGELLRVVSAKALIEVALTGGYDRPTMLLVRVHEVFAAEEAARTVLSKSHEDVEAGALHEAISRDLSMWLACTDLPSRVPVQEKRPTFYLDTTGTYLIFLAHEPVRNVFHNAGFGFGISYQVQRELDVFGRISLLTAFPDKYNDLVTGFTSIRAHTGIGYTVQGKWGRFFVHTGLDLHYLSSFASSTDPFCKVNAWRSDKTLCEPSHIEYLPYRLLGGAGVTVGVDVMVFGRIFLTVKVGASTFFFPASPTASLNFPLVGEVGLGYAVF